MATQIITMLTDDIDGGQADRTVEFGLDGIAYEIELSDKNIGKLRKALDPYLAGARRMGRATSRPFAASRRGGRLGSATRVGGRDRQRAGNAPEQGSEAATADTESLQSRRQRNRAIRKWATDNDLDVCERGRIPRDIIERYRAAQAASGGAAKSQQQVG